MKKLIYLFLFMILCNMSYADTEISTAATNLGIGTNSTKNALSISSTLVVGDATYTTVTAPSGGAIIQGNIGIGSLHPGKALDVTGAGRFSSTLGASNLSGTNTGDQTTISGNAGTATALAANPTNCSAGNYPLGIDASGNVESCTAAAGGSSQWFTQTGTLGNVGIGTFDGIGIGTTKGNAALVIMPTAQGMNVGIGTWNPQYLLEVRGSGSAKDGILINQTSYTSIPKPGAVADAVILNSRGFNMTTDGVSLGGSYIPDLGIGIGMNRAAPAMVISNAGGPALLIQTGAVGLGAVPANALDVNGAVAIGASYAGTNTSPANGLLVQGNVGIGTVTPGTSLDVAATVRAANLQATSISGSTQCVQVNSSGLLSGTGASCGGSGSSQFITVGGAGNVGIWTGDAVGLGTTKTSGAGLVIMNGNLGIGTWNPSALISTNLDRFQVNTLGNVTYNQSLTANAATNALIQNTNATAGSQTVITGGGSNTSNLVLKASSGVSQTDTNIKFNGGNSGAEFARIDVNGNLGIGTASPGVLLDVFGSARVLNSGTVTLGENATIALPAFGTLSADGKYSGITEAGTGGATIAFGEIVYLKTSDSRWYLAKADADSTSGAVRIAIAVTSSSSGNPITVLTYGKIRADAKFPTLTVGTPVYISGATAGASVTAQPTTTDFVIRIIGYGNSGDEMFFNPSSDYLTHT